MANTSSAKGNPASKRMSNPNNKAKRARNKTKNEQLKAKGQHPKQLRAKKQEDRAKINKGLGRKHGQKVDPNTADVARAVFGVKFRPSLIKKTLVSTDETL